jgi:hypothetical protein
LATTTNPVEATENTVPDMVTAGSPAPSVVPGASTTLPLVMGKASEPTVTAVGVAPVVGIVIVDVSEGPTTTIPDDPMLNVVPSIVIGAPPGVRVVPPKIMVLAAGLRTTGAPLGPMGTVIGSLPKGISVLVSGEIMVRPPVPMEKVEDEMVIGAPPLIKVVPGWTMTPPVGSTEMTSRADGDDW